MRRLLLVLMLLVAVPVAAQDTVPEPFATAPSTLMEPDTVAVDTVVVPLDTVPAPPVKVPDSPGDFINSYFSQIILLISAVIMWLLVKFVPGFDVARDLVKWGVYGVSLLVTYVLARYIGGTVPEGLSDLVGVFIDGLLPMLITAFGGVSLYNLSMSQKTMVASARKDPLRGDK